jgi:hypothetical protein
MQQHFNRMVFGTGFHHLSGVYEKYVVRVFNGV